MYQFLQILCKISPKNKIKGITKSWNLTTTFQCMDKRKFSCLENFGVKNWKEKILVICFSSFLIKSIYFFRLSKIRTIITFKWLNKNILRKNGLEAKKNQCFFVIWILDQTNIKKNKETTCWYYVRFFFVSSNINW